MADHDRYRSRKRHTNGQWDRSSDGALRSTMEAILSRLTVLEEGSAARRTHESLQRRSHRRASLRTPSRASPHRQRSSRGRSPQTPPRVSPALACVISPPQAQTAPPTAVADMAPVTQRASTVLHQQPVTNTPRRASSVTAGAERGVSEAPSTSTQATGMDRIVDAIRSIGSLVRSNQHYYVSNFDPNLHNIDDWCNEVDRAKTLNNWNDHECLSRIGNCLKGDAKTWLSEWVTSDRTWGNFKKEFKPLCPKTPDIANILFDVMKTNSDSYPTYADYARRSLLRLRIVRGLSDELISAIIIRGITDSQIRSSAMNANLVPADLVEYFSKFVKIKQTRTNINNVVRPILHSNPKRKPEFDSDFGRKRKYNEGRCYKCGLTGHRQAFCKKNKVDSEENVPTVGNSNQKATFTSMKSEPCSFCKKPGHKLESCFAKLKSESRNANNINLCRENVNNSNRDVVAAVIRGVPIDVLIDSGSTISLISTSVLKHFHNERKPAFRVLRGLGNLEIESSFYITVPIEFDGLTLEVDLFAVDSEFMNTPVIVGTDVLNRDGIRYVRTRDSQLLTRESNDSVMTIQSEIPINTPLEGENLKQLLAIINNFSEHFITGTATSTVNTGTMSIKLNSDTPVNYRPYRLSHAETLRVRDIVKDLLDKGIIRESESDYASPILLVKKKDGSDRMCVDYRKLNEITIKDRFPLPRIDDHIDRLGHCK